MTASTLITIAAYIVLAAALISSIFWIGLAFTWWRLEKKRIKKNAENTF